MKIMRKMKKKSILLVVTLILVLGNSISAYAASCKNPTVVSKGKTKVCTECNAKDEYIQINLHKGHKLKEVKVDGKNIFNEQYCKCQKRETYSNGKCKSCGTSINATNLYLTKGTHKIEVKDDKGYWVTTYVSIDKKCCKHMKNVLSHYCDGWHVY